MSTNRNNEPVASQYNEFHPRVPRSQPMTTKGHKPGVKVGNDAVPEFHTEIHPPGTAPREDTFKPNPVDEVPGQALNPESTTFTDATSTLPGATSKDVHQGIGKPVEDMTSQELSGGKRKKERSGLEGVGAGGVDVVRQKGADLPEGLNKGVKTGEGYLGAEEKIPESAETVASENSGPKGRVYDYAETRPQ